MDDTPAAAAVASAAAAAPTAAALGMTAAWPGATAAASSWFVLNFPPGYHFLPTDAELVVDYLRPRLANQQLPLSIFFDERILDYHPARLIEKYREYGEGRWFFFTRRQRKHEGGNRPNRATPDNGHWNATGSPRQIRYGGVLVGCVRTLVFYEASRRKKKNHVEAAGLPPLPEEEGKANKGAKTEWTMYEYESLTSEEEFETACGVDGNANMDMIVLCTIQKKKQQKKEKQSEESKEGETKKKRTKRKAKEEGGKKKRKKHTEEEDPVQVTLTETDAVAGEELAVYEAPTGLANYFNDDPNANMLPHCFFSNTSPPVSTPPQETMMASAANRGDSHISVHPSTAAMKNYSQFQASPLLAQELLTYMNYAKILAPLGGGGGNNCSSIMAPNMCTTMNLHSASETAPPAEDLLLPTSWPPFNEYHPPHPPPLQSTLKMVVAPPPEARRSCGGFGPGLSADSNNNGLAGDSHRLSTGIGYDHLLAISWLQSQPFYGAGSTASAQAALLLHNKVSIHQQSSAASMVVGSEEWWRCWCGTTQGSSGQT
ncbi:hypothetical protein BAE44_0012776 [Dichanthelium oligosanthes]|uniref:NAC domain-containing protein n=1 Tax=Dichanthelium oligosanthes TaxID=888268 RepID=A0A1E5VMC1_9POAL|nr:hypothetical protein BAE44_0012776 [Dichanthelium oligosanthes]